MKTESTISKNGRKSARQADQPKPQTPAAQTPAPRRPRTAAKAAAKQPTATSSELTAIPRLGPVRIEALAAAGINTLAELRSRSVEDIGKIKWVGLGNARRIKTWLEQRDGDGGDGRLAAAVTAGRTAPRRTKPTASAIPDDDDSLPPGRVTVAEQPTADPHNVGTALSRFKETIPGKAQRKKLAKQLEKVETSVSEVPESFQRLPDRERQQASKALDQIAKVLADAVESGKLTDKKQVAIGADLKKARKRLEKALGS